MCGIVAVLRRPSGRDVPDLASLLAALDAADTQLRGTGRSAADVAEVAATIAGVAAQLRGAIGTAALLADPVALVSFEHRSESLTAALTAFEARLDAETERDEIEALNAAITAAKDAVWAVRNDRIRTARVVEALGGNPGARAIEAFHSIAIALSALDRLEVRGRDSAGLHVLVTGHELDLADPTIARLVDARGDDQLFTSGSVRVADGHLAFVYKTSAEIGELGDNTARLREQITADELLRLALRSETAEAVVLSHTRWASVGIISEANAHPLNQEELGREGPYVVAALNGDVDNYADLKALESLRFPAEITTDAKVIPALVSRRLVNGADPVEAFRATVATFEGSVAIAAVAASDPHRILLAQRGSGQALYVGVTDDAYVIASEPYGVVEECDRYMRLDGETMLVPGDPATQGQVVAISAREGIVRRSYDGTVLPLADEEFKRPEITTRDVDRGSAAHYILKEMYESPSSFRKTLRGRLVERPEGLDVELGDEALSAPVRDLLRSGALRRILVIGAGTAAIAGQGVAHAIRSALEAHHVSVQAVAATELSGFGLASHMSDVLVIAISQSGTTADTNRTVDLVRARGALVIAIVNRRQSDLVDKSDGVLYTSDGRDVEMSVASTKAFYAQIAAGFLLSFALASELGVDDASRRHEVLAALRDMPIALDAVLERRPAIALAAQRNALSRGSWAVVGNGVNRVAAEEIRIKLSELCYKSISCDITEDKKHIDLSAEPMIVVCAAGLRGSNADDVGKEVAIFRAHKSAPIVVAEDGEHRYSAALDTLWVPRVHSDLAFVLCAMAGHLFGYEAALAIDASARPLREARGCIEAIVSGATEGDDLLRTLADEVTPHAARFFDLLRTSSYDGALEAGTAVRLASLLRYATGVVPLDVYQVEFGKVGTPSTLIEDLTSALTKAIEELTRPIDAIKHQAKTVTVGISRSDETLLQVQVVQDLLASGTPRDSLTYRALRTLVALDPAVVEVVGWSRYRIDGDPARGATIEMVDAGGIARDIPTRTASDPNLKGTKRHAASEREVTVVRGRVDGRTLVIVPEIKANQTIGLTLLHVRFHDRLPADLARRVLEGYRDRYEAIADQVTEVEPVMRDDVLGTIDLVDLLTLPVAQLADNWRS